MASKVESNTLDGNINFQFHKVNDPSSLMSVLLERHPSSCFMQNQVLIHRNFGEDLKFYTVGKEINSVTWIISHSKREDYPCTYSISAPISISTGQENVPDSVQHCFSAGGVIDWENSADKLLLFTPTPKAVSQMIADIAANVKGLATEINTGYLYYMEREKALKIETHTDNPNITVRRLDVSNKEEEFIRKTWAYSRPNTGKELVKCISKNASGGVFLNGECVSGVFIPSMGFLSALHTLEEHRRKGYAKLTMNYTFKKYAKDGFIPCLAVERQNPGSVKFHESLGLTRIAEIHFLLVKKRVVDSKHS